MLAKWPSRSRMTLHRKRLDLHTRSWSLQWYKWDWATNRSIPAKSLQLSNTVIKDWMSRNRQVLGRTDPQFDSGAHSRSRFGSRWGSWSKWAGIWLCLWRLGSSGLLHRVVQLGEHQDFSVPTLQTVSPIIKNSYSQVSKKRWSRDND